MAIKPLECYQRRVLIDGTKLVYESSKGRLLIVPGMIFGLRSSYDKKKLRLILNDEINKVYTLSDRDYKFLYENSEPVENVEGLN